jgi:hypothetical protein
MNAEHSSTGMRVVYTVDPEIHDRSFTLDNGFVFKLGRGLDVYKPVAGLAARIRVCGKCALVRLTSSGPPLVRLTMAHSTRVLESFALRCSELPTAMGL